MGFPGEDGPAGLDVEALAAAQQALRRGAELGANMLIVALSQ